MKECPKVTSRKERDLVLYLVNRQRKIKVLILLALGLVQSILSNPFDLLNRSSLIHHHLVLVLKVER